MLDMFRNRFPWTDFHELNASWLIEQMMELKKIVETFIKEETITFSDPIEWNITTQYSKNTVVLDENGNAFLSLQPVPKGIQLNNTDYWLKIFDFINYQEVFDKNITFNVEHNTTQASTAYSVDDWLLWNNVLYKVTQAIAINDDFIIGNNITHFTIEDFIKAFMTWATNTINQYKDDIDASEIAYRDQLANDVAATTASLQAQFSAAIAGVTVDSEVIAARVSYDGVTYTSLGDAIRTQISDLYSVLNERDYLRDFGQFETFDITGWLKYDGTIVNDGETRKATNILPCKEGDLFYYEGAYGVNAVAAVYYNGNTVIGYETKTGYDYVKRVFTAPSGCTKVRFAAFTGNCVARPFGNIINNVYYDEMQAVLENGTISTFESNGYLKYDGTIDNDGEISYVSNFIRCKAGEKFIYSGTYGMNAVACLYYSGDKITGYETKSSISQAEIIITIPDGVNSIRFGSYQNIFEVRPYGDFINKLEIVGTSPLDGAKWYAFGDSFTHGDFTGYVDSEGHSGTSSDAYDPEWSMYKTWAYRIAKRHNMKLTNLAQNGARTTYLTENNLYQNVPSDCDYCTFMLGLNDSVLTGDINSNDPSTWYGAWNVTFSWLRANRPNCKLGIIIPSAWLGNSWRLAIEAVAQRNGVPVFNLYSDSKAPALLGQLDGSALAKANMNQSVSIAVTANNVVSSSNQHPNLRCFEQMSHCLDEFMKNL